MLRNYLTIAWRNLLRHQVFSLINILGLAIGMAACLMVLQYAFFESSFDGFHPNKDRIYRVAGRRITGGKLEGQSASIYNAAGPALKADFPEVEAYARLRPWYGDAVVSHTAGLDTSTYQTVTFGLHSYLDSGKVALAGNFNGWNPAVNPMSKVGNSWVTKIRLIPGRYVYKYVVNRSWLTDPGNPNVDTTDNNNSVLVIPETPQSRKSLKGYREVSFKENNIYFADPSFLSVFYFPMVIGDPATALNEPDAVVISESMARKHFGRDNPVGQVMHFKQGNGDNPKTVQGVFKDVPPNSHLQFSFLLSYKVWEFDTSGDWRNSSAYTYLLLHSRTSAEAFEKKLAVFVERYRGEYLKTENAKEEFFLQPLRDIHLYSDLTREMSENGSVKTIYFMVLIALFILFIAWFNYINLSTARAVERAKEVGVRKVVGASRGQLIGQFLLESFLLNAFACFMAITLVQISFPLFNQLLDQGLPPSLRLGWSFWLAFGGLFTMGTLLSGLYPAFVLSSFKPVLAVKGKWINLRGTLLRKGLVAIQFAASLLLMVGTFTVYQQLRFMQQKDLGLNVSQTLVVKSPLLVDYKQFAKQFDVFRNELLNYPVIRSFTMTDAVPGSGTYSDTGLKRVGSDEQNLTNFSLVWADFDFIKAFGIRLVAGRAFSQSFSTDPKAAIVNEKAIEAFGFANPQAALHQEISYGTDFRYEIIGVVKNYHQKSLKEDYVPMIFLLNPRAGRHYSIKLDTDHTAETLALVERIYQKAFPGNPFDYFFLDEFFNAQYRADRRFGKVFALFAGLAIFVACLGLFGLVTLATSQRTKEIGVRKVLGATIPDILWLLSGDFLKLVLWAALIAWPLAYWGIQTWLQKYAFRIEINPWMFLLPALLVFLIASLTVSFQTLKVARQNPVKALRYE